MSLLASKGDGALAVLLALSVVVPLTVLGLTIWLFFRAARRFDAELAAQGAIAEQSGEREEPDTGTAVG
jgi:hypothetical protein